MILPDHTTPLPPEDETPPFAPDPACEACGKPWPDHLGIVGTCQNLQVALSALKAAAVQTHLISQTLQKIIGSLEYPQSPKSTKTHIQDLLDDMEL